MTVSKRTLIAATLFILVGGGFFEIGLVLPEEHELRMRQHRSDSLTMELHRLTLERDAATRELQPAQAEIARLSSPPAVEFDTELNAWLARVVRLRQLAAERPERTIPEFELLTEKDWFEAGREAKFDTEDDLAAQLRNLRDKARIRLAPKLRAALMGFVDAHNGQLPDNVLQLAPSAGPLLGPAILGRYEMLQHGDFSDVPRNNWLLDETTSFDEENDDRLYLARAQFGTASFAEVRQPDLRNALQSFLAANHGEFPAAAEQLLPFFSREPSAVARKEFLSKPPTDFSPAELRKLLSTD